VTAINASFTAGKKLINAAGNSSQHGARSETPGTQLTNANDASERTPIQRLELENSQLRRLVTDMLLDKLKLGENELRARQGANSHDRQALTGSALARSFARRFGQSPFLYRPIAVVGVIVILDNAGFSVRQRH